MPRLRLAAARPAKTFGPEACQLAADYGLTADPWQELVLSDWLAADRRDQWKAMTCGLTLPRQNGKNACLEIRELFGAVGLGEKILHTAHEVKTARKHFKRLKHFFGDRACDPAAKYPELNALVTAVRNTNGQEAVYLANGGSIEIVARSRGSGRGYTVDTIIIDEAQELSDDALEALMSTASAAPLGNPQLIWTGTVPGPNSVGEAWTRLRRQAIDERPRGLCWHEWSPDPTRPLDLDDWDLIRAVNPSLESGRLLESVIHGERKSLSEAGFARERLGLWPAGEGARRAISPALWEATAAPAPADGIRSFAVAFSADGTRQALAGAVKHDGGVHVNVIGAYTGTADTGVAAVADWLAARWRRTAAIEVLGGAGGPALADALHARGVPKRIVHQATTADYLTACSTLMEDLRTGLVTHPADSSPGDALDDSVAVCDRKRRRADGSYGWEATTADGDETPLEAISMAAWAAKTTRRRPGRKQEVLV
ncbi:hypothetical protein [Propionibacterium australiense]|uniref:Phage Terminase n=1 Tax=Propionibacterium australiense TaxID=119981 RepID=A0A8B3GHX5_9ACTN|nr:hypothetical protein [Propionibacterium australiense]RLP12255.1 hypothetical protein D7U36_03070 [Propionibacterium australiense]